MRVCSIWCLLIGIALIGEWAVAAGNRDSDGDLLGRMFTPAAGQVDHVAEGEHAGAVRIDGKVRRVEAQVVPIRGGRRYEMVLTARVDGPFVVERNDRAHELTLDSFRYALASSYTISFLNDDHEEITSFGYGFRGFFLTEQWHPYVVAFYTPPGAVAVRVSIHPAGHSTYLRQVGLKELTDQPAINPNPDFRYGELNYSGWQPRRDGRLYQRSDGVVVLRPGYGGVSGLFPLSEGATYHVRARGEGGRINMVYFAEDGSRIHTRFMIRPSDGDNHVEFTPPEGARFGQLLTYGIHWLEWCHVTPAPDILQ